MDAPVALEGIVKRFGAKLAVDHLDMTVEAGEVYGFLGPNGAGKTTTLRILMGILDPDRGRRRVLGDDKLRRVTARIGYLPEERGLYQNMTAVGLIAYFASLKGWPTAKARRRALDLLERFGLGAVAKRKLKTYSKGMAQKVQVLAAVAHDPDLIILDEPFSGLDPVNQTVLEGLIGDLKAAGKTVIFSTHVMQHAERLCDRLHIVAQGRSRFVGRLDAARALLPTRIELVTPDAPAPLERVGRRFAVAPLDGGRRRILLDLDGARLDDVLRDCLAGGMRLDDVAVHRPSLHDVFIHLVRPEDAAA